MRKTRAYLVGGDIEGLLSFPRLLGPPWVRPASLSSLSVGIWCSSRQGWGRVRVPQSQPSYIGSDSSRFGNDLRIGQPIGRWLSRFPTSWVRYRKSRIGLRLQSGPQSGSGCPWCWPRCCRGLWWLASQNTLAASPQRALPLLGTWSSEVSAQGILSQICQWIASYLSFEAIL